MAEGSGEAPKRRRGPGRPFQKGQSGNPGGSSKKARERYSLASLKGCSPETWASVVAALAAAAKDGDVAAAGVLAKILPGVLDAARVEVDATVRGPLEVVFVDDWKPPLAPQEPPLGPGSTPAAAPSPG